MNIFSKLSIIIPVIFLSFCINDVSAATYSIGGGITVYGDGSSSYIRSTSTPCGVGLQWDLKHVQGYPNSIMQDEYKEEVTVSIYRSTSPLYSQYSGTRIFTGNVVTVPTNGWMTTVGGASIPAYTFKYTDLTAVPGVTYYYYIISNGTRSSYTAFTSHSSMVVNFQRPEIQMSGLYPYEDEGLPFSWSYRNGSSDFSNSCPFVNTPGSGGSFVTSQDSYLSSPNYVSLVSYALGDSLGGPIANLQCTEDKYAFAKAKDTGYFYGFRLIDYSSIYNDNSEIRNIYGQVKNQTYGQVTGLLSDVYSSPKKFDITKTGAASYAFYREICDEGDNFTYHTGCSLEKITNPNEYTIEEIYDDGLFSVSFNNDNYTPPAGKNYYGYYITSVNQYGAESWPFVLGGVSYFDEIQGGDGKLPTCYKCLNPNTINQTEIFPLINIATAKNLKWDVANQKLIQESANQNDTNQQWYIRPSGDQNYANIVSVSTNKALSTNGYLDWSWQTFFDSYQDGPNFPGFIMNYETLDSGLSYGYLIGQDVVDTSDDSQKWCIYKTTIDSSYGSLSNELEPGPTILGLDNIIVDAYILINKATQSSLKISSVLYSDGSSMVPNLNNGALVWLDLYSNNNGTYMGGPSGWPPQNYLDQTWLINLPTESMSCTGPNNETIQSGQNLTYYESNTTLQYYDPQDPSGADYCSDYAISASCNDGVLGVFKNTDGTDYTGDTAALYPQCNNACLHGGVVIPHGSNSVFYIDNTSTECENSSNKGTVYCTNGVTSGDTNAVYDYCDETTATTAPTPVNLNEARLVPNIVKTNQQCRGKVDTNEISTYGLNPSTTTCDIYQIKAGNVDTIKYSTGNPKSTTLTDWPLVDHGKDYKIICKDNAVPNYTTAISKTLKCVLNPEVKEI